MKLHATVSIGAWMLLLPTLAGGQAVTVDEPAVCFGCHVDIEEQGKERHIHAAFEAGSCSDCHNPHASRHAALLMDEERVLCLSCHQEIGEELDTYPTFVVVDLAGDEVIRLTGELTGGTPEDEADFIYETVWDGRNADGRTVAPGTYVCYVEGIQETTFRFIVTR